MPCVIQCKIIFSERMTENILSHICTVFTRLEAGGGGGGVLFIKKFTDQAFNCDQACK